MRAGKGYLFAMLNLFCVIAFSLSLVLVSPCASWAQSSLNHIYIVSAPVVQAYSAPNSQNPISMKLTRGRRVLVIGSEESGFVKLSTKSGAPVWVRLEDLTPEGGAVETDEADLREPIAPRGAQQPPNAQIKPNGPLGFERMTFDLGASGGSYENKDYMEINLGVNAYVSEYLAWRNAFFGRFQSGVDNLYGLDSSMRAILGLDLGIAGISAFAGPGFRFVTKGNHVPFLEGGAIIKVGPFSIGGGVKSLVYNVINRERTNDIQYFFILAGGGSL